jgi:glycosyltransferase involved in cell wall biosynthesis
MPTGGIATYVLHISRLLAEAGETVHVIGGLWGGASKKIEESCGGRLIIHRLPVDEIIPGTRDHTDPAVARKEIYGLGKSPLWQQSFCWQASLFTEKLVREADIDVIEAQEFQAPLYYFQLRRAIGLGPKRQPPCIVHLHTSSEFVVRFNDWDGGSPFWVTAKRLEDYTIAAADAWLCPSNFLARQVETEFGLEGGSIKVIRLPIGGNPLLQRTDPVWRNGTICYVGRLEPRKGVIEWVDAAVSVCDKYPSAQFDFIGEDLEFPDGKSVQEFVEKRIPVRMRPRFRFRGRHERADLPGFLGQARIAVVPSRWENFPNTCVEAMCSGLPVISTRMGGMAEMIKDNQTGWLSANPRSDGLAEALVRALETPPMQLAEMGDRAASEIREICDNKGTVERHLEFRRQVAIQGVKRSYQFPVNLPWSRRPLSDESARRQAKNNSQKGLAIVIDLMNESRYLSQSLEMLEVQIQAPAIVVIIVDYDPTDDDLKSVVTKARSLGYRVCEVAERSSSARKNQAIQTVLASGIDPIAFVFLGPGDYLYKGYIETVDPVFSHCPDVGLVSPWMQTVGDDDLFVMHPCPAFPYQHLKNETVHATAVRTEALIDSGMFRAGLDSGFDQWDLVNAVMASGWIAITYPELLCDQIMHPGAAFVGQPSMRRKILERHPDVVARDAQALVQLLESRVTQLESNNPHAERSAFHIKRPRDFFGLTPDQQFRAVRKVIRNPRMGFNFMIYHTKISLQKFGSRIWNTIPGRRTNDR